MFVTAYTGLPSVPSWVATMPVSAPFLLLKSWCSAMVPLVVLEATPTKSRYTTGMSTLAATTHAICVSREDFKPRYYSGSFTADNQAQDTGAEVCGTGERVVGLGGATNATGSAIVTIFGVDSTDNDLKLDDGTSLTVDNFNTSLDIFPETYAVCAA